MGELNMLLNKLKSKGVSNLTINKFRKLYLDNTKELEAKVKEQEEVIKHLE